MRFQIASDLHLERWDLSSYRHGPLKHAKSDALILAGDINRIDKVRANFADWPCPVLYVRGNHDSFFTIYEREIDRLIEQANGVEFCFLEESQATVSHIRILGCCLWTDFALFGRTEDAMLLAKHLAPDYRCLRRGDGTLLSPMDTLAEHNVNVRWLSKVLHTPFDGTTIVVTHHAPHVRSLNLSYGRNRFDAGFASDLSTLMQCADFWIHGHVHTSCDYKIRRCRVINNPAGNPAKLNQDFDPTLVIDV
jgi:predicted phosphodiesterase